MVIEDEEPGEDDPGNKKIELKLFSDKEIILEMLNKWIFLIKSQIPWSI